MAQMIFSTAISWTKRHLFWCKISLLDICHFASMSKQLAIWLLVHPCAYIVWASTPVFVYHGMHCLSYCILIFPVSTFFTSYVTSYVRRQCNGLAKFAINWKKNIIYELHAHASLQIINEIMLNVWFYFILKLYPTNMHNATTWQGGALAFQCPEYSFTVRSGTSIWSWTRQAIAVEDEFVNIECQFLRQPVEIIHFCNCVSDEGEDENRRTRY